MTNTSLIHKENYSVFTIERPNALNALNAGVFSDLDTVLSNPLPTTSRLLVVTGSGDKAFAAGADITEFTSLTPEQAQALSRKGQIIFDKLQSSTIPTLALIQGYALGGGLELALACHMRLVTRTAMLGLPELNLGLIPGYGGTQRLHRLIGRGKAMYYTLTSENMDASGAIESGLADFLVDDEESAIAFVEKFAAKLSRKSAVSTELVMKAILHSGNENGFELESRLFAEAFRSEDMKEGVAAFLEKRKPTFIHR
jgi:enoyl-CoA hydratase